MKYIRTKDGIIDLTILPNLDINDRGDITWYSDNEIFGYMIENKDIVKTANTIEELCDEFVVIYNNGMKNQFKANEMANEVQTTNEFVKNNFLRFHDLIVYGAIWTDKGLIYVAKMNKKGELELL